jgi:benzoate-CoA ligase family protein
MRAAELLPERFNVAAHFVDRNVAEGRGERPAFLCESRDVSYADLLELTNRTGNVLLELGVARGERVFVACLDSPEFLGAFWGAIKIGAVPVPVNTLLRAPDYLYQLNDSEARVAVISRPLLDAVGPALGDAKRLEHALVGGGPAGSHLRLEERQAKASPELQPAPTLRDDPAFWLYSSGSTGFPKGAVHLQHDMVICAETYAKQVLGIRASDRVLSAAKLFFAYGLGNAGYFPLAVGAHAVLYPQRPAPQAMFEVIARQRPTLFFAVPTLFAAMLAIPEAEKRYDTSSLRLCVSAGEALPPELLQRWRERFGVDIVDGIGTTETLHMFLSNRPGDVRPGYAGQAVPGYEAIVVDDAGRPVPDGEIGNLRIKGDSTMSEYWNQPEKTRATLHGEWIQTGDKFIREADGWFRYCGRSDDMLKVGGIWVSPAEVEATLVAHDAVLEAAVVGREDEQQLVKPVAYVVLKDAARASPPLADELRDFVKARIAPYKAPRAVQFVSELPKTATGKIQRFKLRAEAR